jgi:hypothetical protein
MAATMSVERQSDNAGAQAAHNGAARRGAAMKRVAIIARLKAGSEQRAAELVRAGPPLNLAETGIVRHSIYIKTEPIATPAGERSKSWA